MAPSFTRQHISLTISAFLFLPLLVTAIPSRTEAGYCPANAEDFLVYSPFQPYFTWWHNGDPQSCWSAADCLFEASGESRKQQFGATALVMGLIPLTLKDVAWPERRTIYVTKRLNFMLEVLVLGLGLIPDDTGDAKVTRAKSRQNNMIARKAWKARRVVIAALAGIFGVAVLASYAGIVVMEIFSKRSALGCPFPVWVASWYVVGLAPACIHALFAALRRHKARKVEQEKIRRMARQTSGLAETQQHVTEAANAENKRSAFEHERKKKSISAVPGAEEEWPVQLAWGLYYIAGTLIYTSIMAVTVVELVCWVALAFAVDGSSKLLAFFLCLLFEETGEEEKVDGGTEQEQKNRLVAEHMYEETRQLA